LQRSQRQKMWAAGWVQKFRCLKTDMTSYLMWKPRVFILACKKAVSPNGSYTTQRVNVKILKSRTRVTLTSNKIWDVSSETGEIVDLEIEQTLGGRCELGRSLLA
jgi:hypothetical protein